MTGSIEWSTGVEDAGSGVALFVTKLISAIAHDVASESSAAAGTTTG